MITVLLVASRRIQGAIEGRGKPGPALKLSFYGAVHGEPLPIEQGAIQDGGADEIGEALEAGLGGGGNQGLFLVGEADGRSRQVRSDK